MACPHQDSCQQDGITVRRKPQRTSATKRANRGHHGLPASTQPRRAASIAATSIFLIVIIASNARLASSPPAAIASVSTRGVICHETPHLSLHQPQALS